MINLRTILFFGVIIFLTSFSLKREYENIEDLINQKKIVFHQTEIKDIKVLFGKKYKLEIKSRGVRWIDGETDNSSNYSYYYENLGLKFILSKNSRSKKNPRLIKIFVYPEYMHPIKGNIKLGISSLKDLGDKIKMEEVSFNKFQNDSILRFSYDYENFTFRSELKYKFKDNLTDDEKLKIIENLSEKLILTSAEITN
jgi:hypothetical protein